MKRQFRRDHHSGVELAEPTGISHVVEVVGLRWSRPAAAAEHHQNSCDCAVPDHHSGVELAEPTGISHVVEVVGIRWSRPAAAAEHHQNS